MGANRKSQRWTFAEFARLPSEGGTRHEVIGGDLVLTPAPALRHQAIVGELVHLLVGFSKGAGTGFVFPGPVDVLLAEGDYLEPDIVFVRGDRSDILTDRGVEGPPDLVIEVLSPSTADRDRGVKLDRYRVHGVVEYWIVDPEKRTVEVWKLAGRASTPIRLGEADTLKWMPGPGPAELAVHVGGLFGPE
jgi:Uma2 family endonuclease